MPAHRCSQLSLPCSVFPNTWVWVLQFLLEPGESRAQGFRVLQKHFVHDQHRFLSDVGFSVGHLGQGKSKKSTDS